LNGPITGIILVTTGTMIKTPTGEVRIIIATGTMTGILTGVTTRLIQQ